MNASEGDTEMGSIREYARVVADIGYSVEKINTTARGHVSPHSMAVILKAMKPDQVFVMHTLSPTGLKGFIESQINVKAIAPKKNIVYEL